MLSTERLLTPKKTSDYESTQSKISYRIKFSLSKNLPQVKNQHNFHLLAPPFKCSP